MKITNDMLAQYLANKALIKELTEANEVIAIGIRSNGGADTREYIAVVEEKTRRNVAPIGRFEELMGPGWLESKGLLTIACWQQVVIVQKSSSRHKISQSK
jgi:hypothetical protein